jgi:hypothetical protein
MAIYNCYRHGKIEITYLDLLTFGEFRVVAPCPGNGPAHTMVLQKEPEKKTDDVS